MNVVNRESNFLLQALDSGILFSIIIISLLISILSLAVPISAQLLVNVIAFGNLLRPIFTISVIVLMLMLCTGALSVWKNIIIENIQQKIMVCVSLSLAKHLPQLQESTFATHNRAELVNSFFEIIIINKTLAGLLLSGISLTLQTLFGLILLMFYHPLFVFFDGVIMVFFLLIIFLPYRASLESANAECHTKHAVGAWLEETIMNRYLFKFNDYQQYFSAITDKKLVQFLKARNRHFKQLIKHQCGLYGLVAFASSLLLTVGGYLVVRKQLSLGQLVASEIVIGALIYAFTRTAALLEDYYDLKIAMNKVNGLLSLPLDTPHDLQSAAAVLPPLPSVKLGINLGDLKNIVVDSSNPVIVAPASPQILMFEKKEDATYVARSLLGYEAIPLNTFSINQVPCSQTMLIALRAFTCLIAEPQWFSGTIFQNITLNNQQASMEYIFELLNKFGLIENIMGLPEALNTEVNDWTMIFKKSELMKLMIISTMINEPKLLVLDGALDELSMDDISLVFDILLTLKNTAILCLSQRADIKNMADKKKRLS